MPFLSLSHFLKSCFSRDISKEHQIKDDAEIARVKKLLSLVGVKAGDAFKIVVTTEQPLFCSVAESRSGELVLRVSPNLLPNSSTLDELIESASVDDATKKFVTAFTTTTTNSTPEPTTSSTTATTTATTPDLSAQSATAVGSLLIRSFGKQERDMLRSYGLHVYSVAEADTVIVDSALRYVRQETFTVHLPLMFSLICPAAAGLMLRRHYANALYAGVHFSVVSWLLTGSLYEQSLMPRNRLSANLSTLGLQFADASLAQARHQLDANRARRAILAATPSKSMSQYWQKFLISDNGNYFGDIGFAATSRVKAIEKFIAQKQQTAK